MHKTHNSNSTEKRAVDIKELKEMLGCGRVTAERIGADANARFRVGRRVLYNVNKVQSYIDGLGGESNE